MPREATDLILVSRSADAPQEDRVSGWTLSRCDRCQHEVIISPSSQQHLATTPHKVLCVCTHCITTAEWASMPQHFRILPGQPKEFGEAISKAIDKAVNSESNHWRSK